MEKYSSDEVKEILALLEAVNSKAKKSNGGEPTKLEKQIRYLEQRMNFFNPSKEMLGYIINNIENSKMEFNPVLLQKLKDEFSKK